MSEIREFDRLYDKLMQTMVIDHLSDVEQAEFGEASKGVYMNYKKLIEKTFTIKETKKGGARKERYYVKVPSYLTETHKEKTLYDNDKDKLYKKIYKIVTDYYKAKAKNNTIGGLWEKALQYKVKTHKNKSNTEAWDEDAYNRCIASQPIESLEVTEVNNYRVLKQWLLETCDRIKDDGYFITNKTINQFKGAMNIVLDYAVDQGLIEMNLLRNTQFPDLHYQIDKTPDKDESWTREEADAIKEQLFIDNENPFNASNYAVLTAIETGARVGEIVALKWSDLDFTNGCIHIERMESRTKEGRIVVPWTKGNAHKNKGDRYVPFSAELQKRLIELKNSYATYGIVCKDNYVFVDNYGDRKNTNEVDKRSRKAQEHLEIKKTKGMHAYRKTFATLYMEDGGKDVDLQMILGHSNFSTTSTYYIKARKTDTERINRANYLLNTRNIGENKNTILFKRA